MGGPAPPPFPPHPLSKRLAETPRQRRAPTQRAVDTAPAPPLPGAVPLPPRLSSPRLASAASPGRGATGRTDPVPAYLSRNEARASPMGGGGDHGIRALL